MMKYDVTSIREVFAVLSQRANESLGSFNESSIGIGRYVAGSSPWEKHKNGDELPLTILRDGKKQVIHVKLVE